MDSELYTSKFLRAKRSIDGGTNSQVVHNRHLETISNLRRRDFITLGGAFAVLPSMSLATSTAITESSDIVGLGRMAYSPATAYRPYISKPTKNAELGTWVQFDLGIPKQITRIRLYPAFGLGSKNVRGFGFPVRFKLETSNNPSFTNFVCVADHSNADVPNPDDVIQEYRVKTTYARYVRLNVLKLRALNTGIRYQFAMAKVEVLDGSEVLAFLNPTGDEILTNKNRSRSTWPTKSPNGRRDYDRQSYKCLSGKYMVPNCQQSGDTYVWSFN